MDALVQLALMAKAKLVFEAEDTFLSFPALSPLSYPPSDLKLSHDGIATARDLARLSEFARITNQIPRGAVAPVEEGEYLWDICSEVLAIGEPAAGTLSAADQARLDGARAVLYQPSSDGSHQSSPALIAYKQCRDAQLVALEEYRNQQFTAESATDPAEKARWATVDEPRLRQAVSAAEEEWRTHGAKAQIEEAMQVEQAFAARQPSLAWEAWKSDFLGDIDLETDTERISFAPTVFTPSDVFDTAWPRFTLTATEIARLAAEAPPELLDIFGTAVSGGDVESVSFEYRSVALTRSWLPKRLFQSRFWRLGSAGGELSDGAKPPHGRCPAYISALVFARNVEVRRRQQATAAQPSATAPGALLALDPTRLRVESAQIMMARQAPTLNQAAAPQAAAQVTKMLQAVRPATRITAMAAAPAANVSAAQPMMAARSARLFRPEVFVARRPPMETPIIPQPGPRPTPLPSPPPVPAPPQVETPHDEVAILAFICRRVPKCPDPDPSLTWS